MVAAMPLLAVQYPFAAGTVSQPVAAAYSEPTQGKDLIMNRSDAMQDYNRLMELAKQRAGQLRREAIEDFWRGADVAWAASLATARRSAERLAHRLARHAQLRRERAEAVPSMSTHGAEPCQRCN